VFSRESFDAVAVTRVMFIHERMPENREEAPFRNH